jgi:xanthine dehydrogenase iron-sulfur cluster and FAD-binding subunit A
MRASAGYRFRAAQNLIAKYFVERTSPEIATRIVGPAAAPLLADVA